MSKMKYLVLVTGLVGGLVGTAAMANNVLGNRAVVDLRSGQARISRDVEYPGMATEPGGTSKPDCLLVVSSGGDIFSGLLSPEQIAELQRSLVITEMRDNLPLPLQVTAEGLAVFRMRAVDLYMTVLTISSRKGEALRDVAGRVVGSQGFLGLQYLRRCNI